MIAPTPLDDVRFRITLAAMTRRRMPGEYPALKVVADRPLHPVGARRIHKPVYLNAKAYFRAVRKRHNRRLWATLGKIAVPGHRRGQTRSRAE
jgi:hypothetical protein